jgi:hypothetical protein
MTRLLPLLALGLLLPLCGPVSAQDTADRQTPTAQQQIDLAVQAAPEALRSSATVLGYGDDGRLTELREGDGDLICVADEPGNDRLHASCYHESLEPFMKRGRELRRDGVANVDSVRQAELEAGDWSMPEQSAALYNLSAEAADVDAAAGTVENGGRLHVVYLPYATGEETGLPTKPAEGGPWLMEAGQPWAHVMYSFGN